MVTYCKGVVLLTMVCAILMSEEKKKTEHEHVEVVSCDSTHFSTLEARLILRGIQRTLPRG